MLLIIVSVGVFRYRCSPRCPSCYLQIEQSREQEIEALRRQLEAARAQPAAPAAATPDEARAKTLVARLWGQDQADVLAATEETADWAIDRPAKVALSSAEAIPPLVMLLSHPMHKEATPNAAAALRSLAMLDDNKPRIADAGAIPPLVALLNDGTVRAKEEAAWALVNLAANHEANKSRIADAGAIPPLVALLKDGAAGAKETAAWALLNIGSNQETLRVRIREAGAIPLLERLAKQGVGKASEALTKLRG